MPILHDRQEGIALVTLDRGATHAIDRRTVNELLEVLEETGRAKAAGRAREL